MQNSSHRLEDILGTPVFILHAIVAEHLNKIPIKRVLFLPQDLEHGHQSADQQLGRALHLIVPVHGHNLINQAELLVQDERVVGAAVSRVFQLDGTLGPLQKTLEGLD